MCIRHSRARGSAQRPSRLKRLASCLRGAGCSCAEIVARGVSDIAHLRSAGFDAVEVRDVGFDDAQVLGAGFDASELRAAGFNAVQLQGAGFVEGKLLDAGFDAGTAPDDPNELLAM